MPILIALVCVCGIVIVIDLVLLIKWLVYQHQLENHPNEALTLADTTHLDAEPRLPRSPFAETWSLVHPFLAMQAVLIGANVASLFPLIAALAILASKKGLSGLSDQHALAPYMMSVVIFALFAQNFLFVGTVAYCLRKYGSSLKEIGLRKPTLKEVGLGLGLGVLMMLVANGLEAGLGGLLAKWLPQQIQHQLSEQTKSFSAGDMFGKIDSNWTKLIFLIAGGLAAPIGEEVFFRGLLFNSLKRRFNVPAAIVLSGLVFALIHISPLAIFIIFPMGAFLAYVYHRTNSLWVTILMHAVNNTTAFILMWRFPKLGH